MPIRQQAELERSITKEAVEQFKRDLTRAKQNNALGNTSTGNTIIINSIKDFTLEIEKYCIASKKGRPVRSTEAAKAIQEVTPEKAAVIASNIILNSLFECKTRQSLFREIGQGLENELRMMEFKKENPSYYKQSTDNLNSRNAKAKRKLTVLTYVFAHQLNFEVERWSIEKKILAGMVLVELFMETTGLIECILYDDCLNKDWEYGKDFAFVLNVHDEYQAEVKPELVDEYKIMAVEAIKKAGDALGFRCPLDGEAKVGNSWYDTH